MRMRALSVALALAVLATSGAPRTVIAAAPPEDGERLELFNYLPRLGTPVARDLLLARQPTSRVTSTIMIAALGQICMLNNLGAPVSAI